MVGTTIIPVLQMEKLRHSEVESLAHDFTDCVSELGFKPKQSDSRSHPPDCIKSVMKYFRTVS